MKAQKGFTMVEMLMVVAIVAILSALAGGPFLHWLEDSKLEERASTLQETFKWAQHRAATGGEVDVVGGSIIRQRIYIAINTAKNSYRVIQWRDANANKIKDPAEFTLLQQGNVGSARFGVVPAVNRGVGDATPSPVESTFSAAACPDPAEIPLFADFRCARFDGRGFLSEGTSSADVYLTNGKRTCAVCINSAGLSALYRWTGRGWQFVR